ncbi:alpha-1,2-fucosyltransferase [Ilyomonas limi]|uniref:Alpha-1,2-fucosyltransferase n=1 Tax=Ilyomonas limi TaxID=2575867 RepID=A0A4U3L592_9BACT|nr:alpha-1,2-fucosyltransferase [Ilyomonas limi]TKK70328.1 alpha-1,2-fucosyltransferase [Ilyomonas limi]
MNRVLIYGGLGNQMFQYALYKALNERGKKTRISFLNFLYNYHHNGFDLGRAFQLELPFPLNILRYVLLNADFLYRNKLAAWTFSRIIPLYQKYRYTTYIEKREFEYDDSVFMQESSLFIGIWQVESYFRNIKSTLQKEFAFREPTDEISKTYIKAIKHSNSISIHIRRGDFLAAKWNSTHAVIKDKTYYENALAYIEKNVDNPHYFIFSDDLNWVKENLQLCNCTYIDKYRGNLSYIDMYLMSLCKHNIIANSTFSWWAAWLNNNEEKIVIMPDRWLNGGCALGIFPSKWIKLKV